MAAAEYYAARPADPLHINGVLVEIGNKLIGDLLAGDVLYRVDNSYTHYVGDPIAITAHAATLPDHKGHGTLVSLRAANDNRRQRELLRVA
jgi:hypothetical protein